MYISARARTSACRERRHCSNCAVEKRPSRSRGTRNSSLPARVAKLRIPGDDRPLAVRAAMAQDQGLETSYHR